VRKDGAARLWSRQRKELTDRFPDIATAAVQQVPDGIVLDGELVILVDGRLSFDALQRRLVTSPAKAGPLIASTPASYVAFDLLANAGVDLRTQRWTTRHQRLAALAAAWRPPLQVSPVTDDVEEAREWFEVLPAAIGTEGLVVKGAGTRYVGGSRAWVKVKRRETMEVLVGGVIGPIKHPEVVIAGRYRGDVLVVVGRTAPLSPAQSRQLGAVLSPASQDHPWPHEISSQRWGGRDSKRPLTKVDPVVVAEVTADAATQAGQVRHPMRFVRVRPDLAPDDVPDFTHSAQS
jgi:ATP-dependent DNA ligase